MPLFYQQHINQHTRLAIWKIEESEAYFASTVPLQRNITHPHKRLQHLAGRHLLRYLFPDFPYQEILIADTRKPYLENEAYHFSISHCGDYAAAIVSKTERVGIDIEIPSDKILKIAHKFTTEAERLEVRSTRYEVGSKNLEVRGTNYEVEKEQEAINQLTLIWCAKETMFKWYGLGKVDFIEMLQLKSITENNVIAAAMVTPKKTIELNIHYQMLHPLVLTFIHSL